MKPINACRWLENKEFALGPPVVDLPDEDPDERFSTPCWCLHTHDAIGPDGRGVAVRACRAGRSCFEPELEL